MAVSLAMWVVVIVVVPVARFVVVIVPVLVVVLMVVGPRIVVLDPRSVGVGVAVHEISMAVLVGMHAGLAETGGAEGWHVSKLVMVGVSDRVAPAAADQQSVHGHGDDERDDEREDQAPPEQVVSEA